MPARKLGKRELTPTEAEQDRRAMEQFNADVRAGNPPKRYRFMGNRPTSEFMPSRGGPSMSDLYGGSGSRSKVGREEVDSMVDEIPDFAMENTESKEPKEVVKEFLAMRSQGGGKNVAVGDLTAAQARRLERAVTEAHQLMNRVSGMLGGKPQSKSASAIAQQAEPGAGYRWVVKGEALLGDDELLRKDGSWIRFGELPAGEFREGVQIRRAVDRALAAQALVKAEQGGRYHTYRGQKHLKPYTMKEGERFIVTKPLRGEVHNSQGDAGHAVRTNIKSVSLKPGEWITFLMFTGPYGGKAAFKRSDGTRFYLDGADWTSGLEDAAENERMEAQGEEDEFDKAAVSESIRKSTEVGFPEEFKQYIVGGGQTMNGGHHIVLRFPNNWGASVAYGPNHYTNARHRGGGEPTFEIAVARWKPKAGNDDWKISYDTHITDDVLGHQSPEQTRSVLSEIKNLEDREYHALPEPEYDEEAETRRLTSTDEWKELHDDGEEKVAKREERRRAIIRDLGLSWEQLSPGVYTADDGEWSATVTDGYRGGYWGEGNKWGYALRTVENSNEIMDAQPGWGKLEAMHAAEVKMAELNER